MEAIAKQKVCTSENVTLKKASLKDEDIVVNILCKSFKNDPCLIWLLEKSKNPDKLEITMRFLFRNIITIGHVYLTGNNTATALWKCEKKEKLNLDFLSANLRYLIQIGFKSVYRILKNESFSYKQYPKKEKYCHLYLIGVLPEEQGKGYASLLLNPVLNEMKKKSRPVFIETANLKNVQIYIKKGFNLYNKWMSNGFELFYLRT
jgi:GNAT superfamily N-acetyltransferase